MKIFTVLSLLAMFITSDAPTKIIFFGDSITQAGVNKGGYIDRLQQMLAQANKTDQYELIGAGISGNKVYGSLSAPRRRRTE